MKLDLNLDAKDWMKLIVLLGAGAATAGMSAGGEKSERLAVLETKVEQIRTDVADIKALLRHRR